MQSTFVAWLAMYSVYAYFPSRYCFLPSLHSCTHHPLSPHSYAAHFIVTCVQQLYWHRSPNISVTQNSYFPVALPKLHHHYLTSSNPHKNIWLSKHLPSVPWPTSSDQLRTKMKTTSVFTKLSCHTWCHSCVTSFPSQQDMFPLCGTCVLMRAARIGKGCDGRTKSKRKKPRRVSRINGEQQCQRRCGQCYIRDSQCLFHPMVTRSCFFGWWHPLEFAGSSWTSTIWPSNACP